MHCGMARNSWNLEVRESARKRVERESARKRVEAKVRESARKRVEAKVCAVARASNAFNDPWDNPPFPRPFVRWVLVEGQEETRNWC